MFEALVDAVTAATSDAARIAACKRLESAVSAQRLARMAAMLDHAYAMDGSAERDHWCLDNWGAVAAQIGAAQHCTTDTASAQLFVAYSLRERFPHVGELFAAGLLDYAQVQLIVSRALLVQDADAVRTLDEQLAQSLGGEGAPLSLYRLRQRIDQLIHELDPLAVRRTRHRARGRHCDLYYDHDTGTATLDACLFATDAHTIDTRLQALADTVCPADPRTRDQRRADAVMAMATGAQRLTCLCDNPDCPAADAPPPPATVIIHLVAHHDTINDHPETPRTPDGSGPDDAPDGEGLSAEQEPVYDRTNTDESESPGTGLTGDPPTATTAPDPTPTPEQECAALDGISPPLFSRPWREMTLQEMATDPGPEPPHRSPLPPAVLIGHGVLPGAVARHTARTAGATLKLSIITHPGQAPPEPHYRPSRTLAEYVRTRDLTCRYPGCRVPATHCDLDHTIPWPYGPTCASNLTCLCRHHHLLKTFWFALTGWQERQLPDGTVHWIDPTGTTHTTTPGSRTPFPSLCQPTAPVVLTGQPPPAPTHTHGLTMPRRRRTRSADRDRRIGDEREDNRTALAAEERAAEERAAHAAAEEATRTANEDPPPF